VGIAKKIRCSRFDLHEHEDFRLPISADKIDFTSTFSPEIPEKHFVSRSLQEMHSNFFSSFANAEVRRGRRQKAKMKPKTGDRFEPPEQMFADGGYKVRESAISQGVLAYRTLCYEQIRKPETPHAS
jgi:hypothetical protein